MTPAEEKVKQVSLSLRSARFTCGGLSTRDGGGDSGDGDGEVMLLMVTMMMMVMVMVTTTLRMKMTQINRDKSDRGDDYKADGGEDPNTKDEKINDDQEDGY